MEILFALAGCTIGVAMYWLVTKAMEWEKESHARDSKTEELESMLKFLLSDRAEVRGKMDDIVARVERVNEMNTRRAAVEADMVGILRKTVSDLELAIGLQAKDVDSIRTSLEALKVTLETAKEEQSKTDSAFAKWMHETFGEFDVRQQGLKDEYNWLNKRLNKVDVNIGALADRIDALEARVTHRKRTPKQPSPTDGTENVVQEPVITVGDFENLNPDIFKEVN